MKSKLLFAAAAAGALGLGATATQADTIELTGMIRDFRVSHPDMETYPGTYLKIMSTLDDDGKPQLDMDHYNATLGTSEQSVSSPESFAQWFRDVPDVNISIPFAITLDNKQSEPGGVYSYAREKQLSGDEKYFFPIDGQGFGLTYPMDGHPLRWASGGVHNYHFTYELKTTFSYEPGQVFKFVGDDDVWVFVNGNLIVDLGGVHPQESASVLLFDGKAFVDANFSPRVDTLSVDSSMANQLAEKWTALGMAGDCPVTIGAKYVELNLAKDGVDIRCEFTTNTVKIYCEKELSNVVVKLEDGTEVKKEYKGKTYQDTIISEQPIKGVWVKSSDNASGDGSGYGEWFEPAGNSNSATLDLFFAERHTSESNFRIDTTIEMTETPLSTISPLYD